MQIFTRRLLNTLLLAAVCVSLWLSLLTPAGAACINGSTVDCNPPGSTLNPAAAFVDPAPPSGYTQCAGFINTPADDVAFNWENNCIPFKNFNLYMRVFDDVTGQILAGARLHTPTPLTFAPTTGYNYRADQFEGEGLLDNPTLSSGLPGGVSLAWHETD